VDGRRLTVAGDDKARAAMRLEIFGDCVDPFHFGRPEGLRYVGPTRPTRPTRPT